MKEPNEYFADMTAQRLAAIYAEALLNAAEGHQSVARVLEEIDSLIDDVFPGNQKLGAMFTTGLLGRKSRKEAIQRAFAGRASDIFYQFLQVLNEHERLDLIRPIRRALHQLHDERARRLRVHVYSAVPLSDEFKAGLLARVHERFNLDPVLELHVEPELLGGLKIRIGDRIFDGTVRTRLDNLHDELIARSSHEIQTGRDRFSTAE